jgi:selenocysteine-specific elongation factor
MATLLFFGLPGGGGAPPALDSLSLGEPGFSFDADYLLQDELYGAEGRPPADAAAAADSQPADPPRRHHGPQWALLQFEEPVTAPADAVVIGARLDADLHAPSCRIAFHGRVRATLDPGDPAALRALRVYSVRRREGSVERVEADGCTAVCRGMFQKDSDLARFAGLAVAGPRGEAGVIEGSFGKSGKFRARFPGGVAARKGEPAPVTLTFRRYLYDQDKRRMAQ